MGNAIYKLYMSELSKVMNRHPKVGDIQIDNNKSEWVVVGVTHSGVSRVKRNSLAHQIHAQSSIDIAKSYTLAHNVEEY
jgi:hypothetical protein